MGFIHVAVAVLGLLSVGQSAPVTSCESLIQPLEIQGRDQLLGKWMQVAQSTNSREDELLKKNFQSSAWTKITAANESDAVGFIGTSKAFGFCLSTAMTMTMKNNTLQPSVTLMHTLQRGPVVTFSSVNLLKTSCSDCLLFTSPHLIWGAHTNLHLLSKRSTVTAAEMEEFKKQAECLNLPPPFTLNSEGDVCAEPPSEETNEPHLFLNGQLMRFTHALQKITNSFGGPEKFVKMVTEVWTVLTQELGHAVLGSALIVILTMYWCS